MYINKQTHSNNNNNNNNNNNKMQSQINISYVLLDYSDLADLDVYLPKENQTMDTHLLQHFPYLSDTAVRELNLTEFYHQLSLTRASSQEVEQLRAKRRRLQKSHFKQKYDKKGKAAYQALEENLGRLTDEKEELVKVKLELQSELNFYREYLEQN